MEKESRNGKEAVNCYRVMGLGNMIEKQIRSLLHLNIWFILGPKLPS